MSPRSGSPVVPQDAMTVRDALAEHYLAHGLPPDGGASATTFRVRIGPLAIRLPNPPARRRAVLYHDVNHLVTGYDTRFAGGEMAIAAFEVGAGCGRFGIAWYINLSMLAIAVLLRPRTAFHGFVRGRHSASIYHDPPSPDALQQMSVAAVRHRLDLDAPPPHARPADLIAFMAWSVVALVVWVSPLALLLGLLWAGVRGS